LFSFSPTPLYFLFSSLFLTASSYDRGLQISIMLKIILRTTHTIFDELLNRSQNKTTCYYIQQKLKNEMKKPDVCLEEKNCQEISILVKKSLQLEYLFIISEIFLEFIYKLHILKMSMKPNHPLKSQLSIDWKTKVKTKRIPSKQRNSNLASKN